MDRNFSSKEDLDAWLASLNPVYEDEGYAEILFCIGGVRFAWGFLVCRI